jgi:hypothetical protein
MVNNSNNKIALENGTFIESMNSIQLMNKTPSLEFVCHFSESKDLRHLMSEIGLGREYGSRLGANLRLNSAVLRQLGNSKYG